MQIAKPNRNPKSQEVRGTLCNLEERERPKSQISNRRGSRGDKSQVQNPRLGQTMFVAVAVLVVVSNRRSRSRRSRGRRRSGRRTGGRRSSSCNRSSCRRRRRSSIIRGGG